MKLYRVEIVENAQLQWERYYDDIFITCGPQQARNTQADMKATILDLTRTAGSRPLYHEVPMAAGLGYHRINFIQGHRYYMLYRLEGDVAIIDYIANFRRSVIKMMTEEPG